ncbi:MAG TPA: nucleotide exchange factor GrpE [Planctomycetaceae bacterium]|jgi:molecular chaperone GrpE|nr:nucleotide exchange factor GrpE [Planctomycetaceae bacterium]
MSEKPKSQRDGDQPKNQTPEGADSPEAGDPTASISLLDQLEAARAERDANYDLYMRSQAELQNYRRRAQKEADEMRQYQALPVARDLLPALDNLHRALAAAESSGSVKDLVNGVRLVAKQIEAALGRHDVVPIESAGKPFDPNLHQAIQQVQTDEHPPMTVVQEVERGFTLKDRVVRPATVIVSTSPADGSDNSSNRSASSGESE